MGIIFWICTISVVCIIASVIYCKPYLGIVFVIICIPFEGLINLDSILVYPLEAVMFILVSVCIFRLVTGRENHFENRKLIFYYFPFVLCLLLSASKFMKFSLTVKEIVRWLELIVIYYLTINLINNEKKIRVILYSMALVAVVVSICAVVNYLVGTESVSIWRPGAYSFFGHPNALAGYVNLIIPVLFGMCITSFFLWERITFGISSVLSILTWFLTFSRSAWISLVLTTILLFFLTKAKKRVAILLTMLFAIFATTFLSSSISVDFMGRLGLQEVAGRYMFYPIGFNMVKDDLVFGIGIGNYSLLIMKFTEVFYIIQNDLHCLYLQIFVEVGIMGICSFVFWLTGILRYLISALESFENYKNYGLFVGLVGGVIVYLFNNFANVLTVHGIHLQWGIILGLTIVLIQFRESGTCLKAV